MRTNVVVAGLVLFATLPAATPAPAQAAPRSISVTGQAEVRVVPSQANVVFGVETLNKVLASATEENDRRVRAIVQSLATLGIAAKDVQTDFIQVEPRYDDVGANTVLRHYVVRKTIAVTIRDISVFERSLSAALQAGATHINSVQFLTTDLRKYRDEARARAIQAARQKAVALAGELNARVGKVITIQEYGSGAPWNSYNNVWGGRFGGAGANQVSVQSADNAGDTLGEAIALGQIGITASVSVSFELEVL